jgi:hypothetical protein
MNGNIVLTIDLGSQKDDIIITPFDSAKELAKNFCNKHNLSSEVLKSLTLYLSNNFSFSKSFDKKLARTPDHSLDQSRINLITTDSIFSPNFSPKTPTFASSENKKSTKRDNPGERLYYQGLDQIKHKKETISKLLAEKQANELASLTFTPFINSKKSINPCKPDIMLKKSNINKSIFQQKKRQFNEEKYKECSFKPKINKESEKLSRSCSKDRNIELYESFRVIEQKMAKKSELL